MARKEIRDGRTVYIPGNAPDKFFYTLSKAQRYERTCGGWAEAKAGKPTKRGSLVKSGGLGRGYSGDLSAAHKAAKVGRARNARGQFVGLADTPVGPQDELLIVVGNEAGVLLYLYEMWLDDGDQGGYVLAESAPHRSGKLQIKKRGKVEPHGDPAPLFEKLRKLATPAPEWGLNRLDTERIDSLMGKGYSASLAEGFSGPLATQAASAGPKYTKRKWESFISDDGWDDLAPSTVVLAHGASLLYPVFPGWFRPTATGKKVFRSIGGGVYAYTKAFDRPTGVTKKEIDAFIKYGIKHSGDDHHVFFEGLRHAGGGLYEVETGS